MDPFLLMLFFGIIGIIGITFGLTWMIFKARYKDKLVAPSAPTALPLATKKPERPPFLKLEHTPTGTWEIDIKGQRYRTLEAVPNDTIRQEVVAGIKELVTFARSYIQKTQTTKKRQPAPTLTQEKREQPPAPKTTPPAEKPASPLDVEKARVLLRGEPTLKRQAMAPTLMPSIDLAREIGEIVSEMQVRIPSLAGRSIRLQNAPGGGVQFAIDGIVYPDVDSIPDLDIQALIRAATQEWERR